MSIAAILRLARLHKPIGILLLWAPTAWALWFAQQNIKMVCLFFIGTVSMRSAGCVLNDIVDRDIDNQVRRTRTRPLTSNAISLLQAFLGLGFFLSIALLVLLQLPTPCIYFAFLALFIMALYPFCKRFIQAPQVVLGLAFSMGIPMAFAASNQPFDKNMFLLFIINTLWTVAYDTAYAMADKTDDLRIGVKSTAILFAQYDRMVIACLQIVFHGLWLVLAYLNQFPPLFYYGWALGGMILLGQHYFLNLKNENHYLTAFNLNGWYGMVLWGVLMLM